MIPTHFYIFIYFLFVCFLGPHLWHMDVPGLEVEAELQLSAYAMATTNWNLSHVCDLHHSSWQHWIFNPLSEARDQTRTLMDTSWVPHCRATTGTPPPPFLDLVLLHASQGMENTI